MEIMRQPEPPRHSSGHVVRIPRHFKALIVSGILVALALVGRSFAPWSLGDIVRSIDGRPGVDHADSLLAFLVTCAFLAVTLLGLRQREPQSTRPWYLSGVCFGLLLTGVVFLWRWPFLRYGEMNVDESQDIAAAITLLTDPRYWHSADAVTHGPLIPFSITIPALFGMAQDYAASRLLGIGLMTGSLLLLYGIFKAFFPKNIARLLTAPAVLSVALVTYSDFVAYNGEHLPIFLWVLAAFLGVRALRTSVSQKVFWYGAAAGFVCGMVPYAKLQAAPCAAVLALLVAGMLAWRVPTPGIWRRLLAALPCLVSALLPTVIVLLYLSLAGLLPYVFHSYIIWNLEYATGTFKLNDPAPMRHSLRALLWPARYLPIEAFGSSCFLSILSGGIVLTSLRLGKRGEARPGSGARIYCALGLAALAYYAVCKPGHVFGHYLLLLLFPLLFLNGVLWGRLIIHSFQEGVPLIGRRTLIAFVTINIALPLLVALPKRWNVHGDATYPGLMSTALLPARKARPDDGPGKGVPLLVARELRRFSHPGDRLVVWGWAPSYHVLTALPQGTRDSILPRIHMPGQPTDPFFYSVFLEDMETVRPTFFVDETGPASWAYSDRRESGHEAFPEVNVLIRDRYDLVEEIGGVRIYRKKDRHGR